VIENRRDKGMRWLLGMTGVMSNRQRQGLGSLQGTIPHICQKQIPIPRYLAVELPRDSKQRATIGK